MRANLLSRLATSASADLPKTIYFGVLKASSIKELEPVMNMVVEPSWMDPLVDFIKDGTLSIDRAEARRLKRQAAHHVLHEDKLYQRSFSLPLLRCLRPSEVDYTFWKVHEGICSNYLGGRALAHKIL